MAQLGLVPTTNLPASTSTDTILLQPRRYAKAPGSLTLIPLLPHKPPAKALPAELWIKILGYVFAAYAVQGQRSLQSTSALKQNVLLVCKTIKEIALPLYYRHAQLATYSSLERFTNHLLAADKQWDSIRRIPYSTPGRWVQVLDLTDLRCSKWSEVCYRVDDILARLLPLLPFMGHLVLNDTLTPSFRLMVSLRDRDGNERLKSIQGLKIAHNWVDVECPFLQLLQRCPNLEQLEFSGCGVEPLFNPQHSLPPWRHLPPETLHLPRLRKLSMISTPCSPAMFALLHSELPSLTHLTITPYEDVSIPASLVPQFISTHGEKLSSLHLYSPKKSWPNMHFPSPTNLLHTCPNLYHLSLENPLPTLTTCSTYPKHPLRILSIPRPLPEFLTVLDSLLPNLPDLQVVRARDVKWLRPGMSSHAMEAGVQGELRQWRQRLARRKVDVVDATWSPPTA
ncbi:hypothetical protein BC835DRAFT_1419398 [Cytidiella melzeri]|nr:hypothetical protein BC835DRAFT_1419398 [Cytidiella melzeri]